MREMICTEEFVAITYAYRNNIPKVYITLLSHSLRYTTLAVKISPSPRCRMNKYKIASVE